MDKINQEIETLKRVLMTHQNIFSDIHRRLSELEQKTAIAQGNPRDNSHYFYNKDENGCWLVKCAKTGGSFSTSVWRNEVVQKQKCPCCGGLVTRRKD